MKRLKWILILSAISVAVYAYIRADRDRSMWVLNTAIGFVTSPKVVADITYGDKTWQTLNVYPSADTKTPSPVLVFIHGGGWYHGRKEQYFFVADAFLRLGYVVVLPDYVKYPSPDARFPSHIEDAAKAVSWVKENIAQYGGDPNSIFLSGHSAGAHTVALLATDMSYLNAEGVTRDDVRGVAPLAGPFKFIPDSPAEEAVFGPKSNYPKMDPLRFVNGDEPPILILHSDSDQSIDNKHPRELEATLAAADQKFASRIYPDYSHEDMVTYLHPWFAGDKTIAKDVDQFFKQKLNAVTRNSMSN